ncbi:hypothetical protein TELCIR_01434 [Teladorsagia circumcincta]|uniref:Leishmanolysin-like peptidase n=1 Tax=Teladorsagia circumcincta TaxID=45464 RepID=A0A2G9V1X8_TELCI|nr:hypothetical protein TELCIR_01434 [Teladorsagia circumcincta]
MNPGLVRTREKGALSRLTLALFEDSGWYKVNYDKAEDMMWGRNLGCGFAKQSCLTWMKKNLENPYPFCNTYADVRCSTKRLAKFRCDLVENSTISLPDEYNYNVETLYHDKNGRQVVGYGPLETADYCPFYRIEWEKGYNTKCTHSPNMYYRNFSPEKAIA